MSKPTALVIYFPDKAQRTAICEVLFVPTDLCSPWPSRTQQVTNTVCCQVLRMVLFCFQTLLPKVVTVPEGTIFFPHPTVLCMTQLAYLDTFTITGLKCLLSLLLSCFHKYESEFIIPQVFSYA